MDNFLEIFQEFKKTGTRNPNERLILKLQVMQVPLRRMYDFFL